MASPGHQADLSIRPIAMHSRPACHIRTARTGVIRDQGEEHKPLSLGNHNICMGPLACVGCLTRSLIAKRGASS